MQGAGAEQQQEEKKDDDGAGVNEFLNNEFVGQIVKDLDLDVDKDGIDKILEDVQKKDDSKKDGDKK